MLALCLTALAGVLVAQGASGQRVPERDVRSVFLVAKSENRNQVHYGLRVDDACAPVGREPVYAYWRMFERGPLATEPLLGIERPAYGFAEQRPLDRGERGGAVRVRLAAMPDRPILVQSGVRDGVCTASAATTISGVPAALESVFVQLRWPFGIAHMVVAGRALADGRELRERIAR
jgi:hypothetical protein